MGMMENSYYEDEVREGFYIPGMVKRSWAAQLDILKEVSIICERHEIDWFADCGTLLGAVRHHGFIPWDDDLDICMLKDDYDRFLSIAEDELPKEYKILNIYSEKDYANFLTRIVNHNVIDTKRDFLEKNHGFPYVSGIDIFPLHYLYSDEAEENERWEKVNRIWKLLEEIKAKGLLNKLSVEDIIENIGELSRDIDINAGVENVLYKVMDSLYSMRLEGKAEFVTLLPFWIKEKSHKFPVSIFKDKVKLPFETMAINVPAGYEQLLKLEYGSWEKAERHGGLHTYPYYEEQEKKLTEHGDGRVPYRYHFDKDDLIRQQEDDIKTMLRAMIKAHQLIVKLIELHTISQCSDLLCKCQEFAIKIGEKIERKYTESAGKVIKLLEDYCETVFRINESLTEFKYERLKEENLCMNDIFEQINTEYMNIRESETIFIVHRSSEWKYIEPIIEKIGAERNRKIGLMPVPYYRKNWWGELDEEKYEYDFFSTVLKYNDHIELIDFKDYDFSKNRAEIYIFDPYDQYGGALSIHPFFYASNLRRYTDDLCYVDIIQADASDITDTRAVKNARKYVVSPGVIMSNTVYLENESKRKFYIEILTDSIQGVEREYWENKLNILCVDEKKEDGGKSLNKKILLYTSTSTFYTYGYKAVDKLKRVLEIFAENKEKIKARWIMDHDQEEDIKRLCASIWDNYMDIKALFEKRELGEIIVDADEKDCDGCDAYYGSGGFFMNICLNKGLPVMVWDIEV